MPARYGVYFLPEEGSALERFGHTWLGRDMSSGRSESRPKVPGISAERLTELIKAPRHYGFHATLKAPFRLAPSKSEADLLQAAAVFSAHASRVKIPPLRLTEWAGFLALRPNAPCAAVDELAASCVQTFDCFRSPLSPDELQRRSRACLTPTQQRLLSRWGYPYVFDQFRFHLTLTGMLSGPEECAALLDFLHPRVKPLISNSMLIREICIVKQADTGVPFSVMQRFPLK